MYKYVLLLSYVRSLPPPPLTLSILDRPSFVSFSTSLDPFSLGLDYKANLDALRYDERISATSNEQIFQDWHRLTNHMANPSLGGISANRKRISRHNTTRQYFMQYKASQHRVLRKHSQLGLPTIARIVFAGSPGWHSGRSQSLNYQIGAPSKPLDMAKWRKLHPFDLL